MKRLLTLLPLLAALSFVTMAGFSASSVSAGPGCKTMRNCSSMQKASCTSKCSDDCCCKKKGMDCCKNPADCKCACCAKNDCCKKMASCTSKCTDDCCCKKQDSPCCKKGADCDCACCKKNGCCANMDKPCKMNKPCCKKSGVTTKAAPEASPEASLDPVCGMDVEVEGAKYTSEFNGKTYYFCNETCKDRFDKDPSKYIGK